MLVADNSPNDEVLTKRGKLEEGKQQNGGKQSFNGANHCPKIRRNHGVKGGLIVGLLDGSIV